MPSAEEMVATDVVGGLSWLQSEDGRRPLHLRDAQRAVKIAT